MRILVTGAYGFLGAHLTHFLEVSGHRVYRQGSKRDAEVQCNLTDIEQLRGLLRDIAPEAIVNLVGMTDVDRCESDPAGAFEANVGVVTSISRALTDGEGVRWIHVSTDQVYSGPGPHFEAEVGPLNVYAITKYTGELIAARAGATILRANFVGHSLVPERTGLSDWIVNSLAAKRTTTLFDDIYFSPLHVSTLCRILTTLVAMGVPGVFNLGARGGVSKAEFGLALAKGLHLDTRYVTVGKSTDVTMKARRPTDMTMDVSLFERTFDCELPTIEKEIGLVIDDYRRRDHGYQA